MAPETHQPDRSTGLRSQLQHDSDGLREQLAAVPGSRALVGGSVATDLDTDNAARHDIKVVIPTVLAVMLPILILLLRSLLRPGILVITVVASYLATLGATRFAFLHLFDFAGIDPSLPLLGFLFPCRVRR